MRIFYVLALLIVFSQCYSQKENSIDFGLRADYSYQNEAAIGPTVGWSNGGHQLGAFWRCWLFNYSSITNNGIGVYYKIFPNRRSKTFNLFYQAGTEFYYKSVTFDHSVYDFTLSTKVPVSTTNKDVFFAYYLGLGFEMKIIYDLRMQISGHLMHGYYSFESSSIQNPENVEYSFYRSKDWQFMPYVSGDIIYRISLNKKEKGTAIAVP